MTEAIDHPLSVAIVGMGLRVPGAQTHGEFWRNLSNGVESIAQFTPEELDDPQAAQRYPGFVPAGAVLDDVDRFDARFFGISAREAALTDPQHRLFLACCHEALEDAACDPSHGPSVGIYAGAGISSYLLQNVAAAHPDFLKGPQRGEIVLANDKDFIATRVAYRLDLRGPAVTVQTACSSSLSAVHQACQALLSYQCDMALAGGVTILLPQKTGYYAQEGGVFSPDGHCRVFDAAAAGTVFGSGVGVVALQRLTDALEERRPIYAVVRGTATNNDGSQKVGFSAPSIEGQAEVIAAALAVADVEPGDVGYVEAHGTGTPLGDPVEIAALNLAFSDAPPEHRCAIGSVKSNVGHLDAASGVVGLIKAALTLHHGQIPPSLHFQEPNPHIDFAGGPFEVQATLDDWPPQATPRRAGVSSFGMGGTNVHAVLEEAPAQLSQDPEGPCLVVLSARTEQALDAMGDRLEEHLEHRPEQPLDAVARTLQCGRRSFEKRRTWVCGDTADAVRQLRMPRRPAVDAMDRDPRIAFLFPGQGAQYRAMGRGLYGRFVDFREVFDNGCEQLQHLCDFDPRAEFTAGGSEEVVRTDRLQPTLFVLEYALAELLGRWGIEPSWMLGHSLGEYVAACRAGVFSFDDALRLVVARGRAMQSAEPGAMLAVRLSPEEIAPHLGGDLELAAINAPQRVVVSGHTEAITDLAEHLRQAEFESRRLDTSHAFHSRSMEPVLDDFAAALDTVEFAEPKIPFVSNVTGRPILAEEAIDPGYWLQHLRRPVLFDTGLGHLLEEPIDLLLEVGPGVGLCALAEFQPGLGERPTLSTLGRRNPEVDEVIGVLRSLGELWAHGAPVQWSSLQRHSRHRSVPLPTYPFDGRRHWIDAPPAPSPAPTLQARQAPVEVHPEPTQAPAADTALERTIALQLDVMREQIALWNEGAATPTPQEAPVNPRRDHV